MKQLTQSEIENVNGGFGPYGAILGGITGAITGGMNGGGWKGALNGAAMGAVGGFMGVVAGNLWKAGYKAASMSVGSNTVALAVVANTDDE